MDNHQQVVKQQSPYKPKLRGGYLLILRLNSDILLSTRSLNFKLSSGYYIYVGSAMNSLFGRVKHHERTSKKFFWHVDFLLQEAELLFSLMITCFTSPETWLASRLSGHPIPKFGASDRKDLSHLFYYQTLSEALTDAFRVINEVRSMCRKPF